MVMAKIFSAASIGFDGRLIEIECDTSNGLPAIVIVGLANKAIDEAKERIRSSIKNSSLVLPRKRITLNLAPADLPKDGACYDIPMAIAILTASEQIKPDFLASSLFVGELSLDGKIRPVRGIISHAEVAKQAGFKRIFVPAQNAIQASLVADLQVVPVATLKDICSYLNGEKSFEEYPALGLTASKSRHSIDFTDIYGQEHAKRALEIAAAGGHNILMNGPPGAGKTMMAKALLSILPPPPREDIIAITKLHSLTGELTDAIHISRPFRAPHHTASTAALIGGGHNPKPGEISLAHKGVLFLDELPEYSRACLEALRQPLEDRIVTVARAQETVTFPADFMLIATQNPCPCGYYMDKDHECSCTPAQVNQYKKKISGPLLDRIDLIISVKKVPHKHLLPDKSVSSTSSAAIIARVQKTRQLQSARFGNKSKTNTHMTNREISQHAALSQEAKFFLESAASKLSLSARSYMKVIRVSRTIADLEGSKTIEIKHTSEALLYRPR